jgi:hypothetical protein
MADSIVAPLCPQATGAADRCGYRSLPLHIAVSFKIYAIHRTIEEFQSGEMSLSVEYRGTESQLIAAGIVTAEFLVPRPGHPRRDGAGRRVKLERRLEGIRVVTFYGDPFAAPRLHAITEELVNEAIEERQRFDREDREREVQYVEPVSEPTTDMAYIDAAAMPLKNLSGIAQHFSKQLGNEVWERIGQIIRLLDKERERMAERRRPSYLRLVVDNEART